MKCSHKGCHQDASCSYQLPGQGGTVYACGVHRFLLEDLIMKATCAVSTCDQPTAARGLCGTHYGRFNHHGWLEGIERVTPEQADEFHRQWSERAAQRLNAQMARKLEVEQASVEYRDEMDTVATFVEVSCMIGPEFSSHSQELYLTYSAWCRTADRSPVGSKSFTQRLEKLGKKLGFAKGHDKHGTAWSGLGLKSKPPAKPSAEPVPAPVVTPPEPADDPKALKARIKSLEDEVALLHRSDRDEAEARDAVQRAEPPLPAGSYAQRVQALIGQRAQALKDLGYANAEAKEAGATLIALSDLLDKAGIRDVTDSGTVRALTLPERVSLLVRERDVFAASRNDYVAKCDGLAAQNKALHDELQALRRAQQAPVPAPPDAVCAVPYLHSLLCRDDKLADDLIEAIVRDVGHRLRAKEPAALASILTDPTSRIP